MREVQIKTEPFEWLSIQKIKIHRHLNEHTELSISGYIENEAQQKEYVDQCLSADTSLVIKALDENEEETVLFDGMVVKFNMKNQTDFVSLSLDAKSHTYLMDLVPHIRTFQDASMKDNDLIHIVTGDYPKSDMIMETDESAQIEAFTLQYKETDWEFLKRMVSRRNSFLLPGDTSKGIKFFYGVPERGDHKVDIDVEYAIQCNLSEYNLNVGNGLEDFFEIDSTAYVLENQREIYEIGDKVTFQGKTLYVYEIESEYSGFVLRHKYYLRSKRGFKTSKTYNKKQIGASLTATVEEIEKECVKIDVLDDENTKHPDKTWFQFATVYSDPNGTGWYCMPEKGDTVRLYIPGDEEKEAFVISAVHVESGERNDPDIKFLKTIHGKEIRFTPDSITLTNNNGMKLVILDDKGILIDSDKNITIRADKDIDMQSSNGTITLIASDSIDLTQGKIQLKIQDDISCIGGKIKQQ